MFVDDEKKILKALKRTFIEAEYDTVFMDDPQKALDYFEENHVDLIISDIRMPAMDGFELLRRIKEKYPLTLRVALSGYTDRRQIYDALESNIARVYMFKPWDNEDLLKIVDNMIQLKEVLQDKKLLDLVNNMDKLPTMPGIYRDISIAIEEKRNVDEIADKIEADQSISSRILRIANSAFYGAKTGVISQAIMYIGLVNVRNIVLSNSVFDMSYKQKHDMTKQWRHASFTNKITNAIYQELLEKRIPNIFATAGLLHDIGSVILSLNFDDRYYDVINQVKKDGGLLEEIEKSELGVSHQEIGGYLLDWWELPLPFVEAAMYHHNPLHPNVINKELVSVVHIASCYSCRAYGLETLMPQLNELVFDFLEINKSDVEALVEKLAEQKMMV